MTSSTSVWVRVFSDDVLNTLTGSARRILQKISSRTALQKYPKCSGALHFLDTSRGQKAHLIPSQGPPALWYLSLHHIRSTSLSPKVSDRPACFWHRVRNKRARRIFPLLYVCTAQSGLARAITEICKNVSVLESLQTATVASYGS